MHGFRSQGFCDFMNEVLVTISPQGFLFFG